jgi:hypothetical protein
MIATHQGVRAPDLWHHERADASTTKLVATPGRLLDHLLVSGP